jgi:glyoxylase-like metal-dependent hydrolase (beta-lactamase superfamily II)
MNGLVRNRIGLNSNGIDAAAAIMVRVIRLCLAAFGFATLTAAVNAAAVMTTFRQPDAKAHPDLFVWTDTCNVYVLRDGDAALLIDLGDGSVLDHLNEIGVRRVEWVLFTHHHREQNQGYPRLQGWSPKIAAPEAERALFERPADFRKMNVRLRDPFTIHGASFVRPPIQPIPLDRTFRSMDTFTWRGHELWCVDTRGNSPGGMSYLLRQGEGWLAFTGDLMMEGARLHTWFDSEWDYGIGAGVWALANSAAQIEGYRPEWLLPSHGPAVREPAAQLAEFQQKLIRFQRVYAKEFPSLGAQDKLSQPTAVPHVWRVLPHVFKFRGPNFSPNFYIVIADSGRALVVDCGLLDVKMLDSALTGMKQHFGLKQIDALIPTHMHGDHFLQADYLQEKWGAQLWALDRMGPVCEQPERFDYACPIQAYGTGIDRIKFDRLFKSGEVLKWEGYELTIDWMPGQTEFALCVSGVIDGRKVAFTGDNIAGDPEDPRQSGHKAMVAHNSAVLEAGYIYGAEFLTRLRPDLLLGGHSDVMNNPAPLIERYRTWAYAMREAFRTLSSEDDYRTWFDPYWVRAEPYRSSIRQGKSIEVGLHLRNFSDQTEARRVEIHAPAGFTVEPAVIDTVLSGDARERFTVHVHAIAGVKPGVQIIALDVIRNGRRYGELFDLVVEVLP